jgi:phosphoribosylformimino-5-aminoimidazole carboxamide ribonucleotide (ProFAR) isomerase
MLRFTVAAGRKDRRNGNRGARDFHIIDLDGAGQCAYTSELIKRMRQKISGYMEVGGGIREEGRH